MQSNGGVMPGGYVAQKAVAVLGSGPAGGVDGRGGGRGRGRHRRLHLRRHGRHELRRLPGARRRARGEGRAGTGTTATWSACRWSTCSRSAPAAARSRASSRARCKVGPQSAGAEPGPVCYGRGGTEPTVTDANLVLGYLNPDALLRRHDAARRRGRARRDRASGSRGRSASPSSRRPTASSASSTPTWRTRSARRLAPAAASIRAPLTLVVFGGNGPVHAGMQAAELGIRRILVPKLSPAFSALGLLLTDHVVDEMRSYVTPGRARRPRAREPRCSPRWRSRRARRSARRRRARARLRFERMAALCYPGQTFDMPVPLAGRAGR